MKYKSKLFYHVNVVVFLGEDNEKMNYKGIEVGVIPKHIATTYYGKVKETDGLAGVFLCFNKNYDIVTVAHECWHAFFAILGNIEEMDVTLQELCHEAYAYKFEELFQFVKESLEKMKDEDNKLPDNANKV